MSIVLLTNDFQLALFWVADRETSADAAGWTADNPLWGHCAVSALLAQDVFGGEILRASLEGTEFAAMRSHYWNRLPGGVERDFTESQFRGRRPTLHGEPKERAKILEHADTVRRYGILKDRFFKNKTA